MKRMLSIWLSVLSLGIAMGQNDSTIAVYEEQFVQLNKAYAKAPSDVANLLDMAAFYSQQGSPYYNLTMAAGYAQRAETIYTAWVQDKGRYREVQKLIRKGVTIPVIRQQRKDIESQAVLYVRSHVPQIDEAEAQAFIEAFEGNDEIVKRLRAKLLSDAYDKACRENTLEGYYAFAHAHPNTVEADSAEAALARLAPRYVSQFATERAVDSAVADYPSSEAVQHAAMRQKSRIAYGQARRENSVEAYSRYLEQYARGDYYLDALERLQHLRNDAFGTLTSPEELADYAQNHSDDPLADSALARLRQMVERERNQRAAEIYLTQFSLDEHYSDVYRQYYGWFAEEGNGAPIRSFAAANPHYPFQRAITSDLARAAVIDSVDLTRPFQESDYDQMETNVRLLTGRKAAFVALQRILQQQIVRKEWSAARGRLQKFDLCFEDVASSEYAELSALLADNGAVASRQELPADDLSHTLIHPTDNYLCYAYSDNGRQAIGYARQVVSGKTAKWQHRGEVRVEGLEGSALPYGFYDQGSMVLLGIGGDIWSAEVVSDSVWQLVEPFGKPINTPYMEQDAYMLEDGTGMLFVSDRPGGMNVQHSGDYYHGDRAPAFDIYFVPFDSLKTTSPWGEAVNLGLGVNTPYCERSPLLSRNMQTLYYVTDAHGLGYGDIYCVTRTDIDDWTHWSKPVNMGRGVNGAFEEASLSFGKGEQRIYYTSGVQPQGRNVYRSFAAHHDTSSCHRQVTIDMEEISDVLRQVEFVEVWRQRTVDLIKGKQLDSTQVYSVYKGKPYALLAEADWLYVPTCSFVGGERGREELQGYTLQQLRERPEAVPLPLVTFVGSTAQMEPLARQELKVLAHFMQQHAGSQIELLVHVGEADGETAYTLSLERATAVRNYLVGCGIVADRIHLSAYGNVAYKQGVSTCPVAVRFL